MVVRDNKTAGLISSEVAPDANAFRTEDITAPLELTTQILTPGSFFSMPNKTYQNF
jgi:hypothetical protein